MLCKWFIQYADLVRNERRFFPKLGERTYFSILIVSSFASLRIVALADFFGVLSLILGLRRHMCDAIMKMKELQCQQK